MEKYCKNCGGYHKEGEGCFKQGSGMNAMPYNATASSATSPNSTNSTNNANNISNEVRSNARTKGIVSLACDLVGVSIALYVVMIIMVNDDFIESGAAMVPLMFSVATLIVGVVAGKQAKDTRVPIFGKMGKIGFIIGLVALGFGAIMIFSMFPMMMLSL